MNTIFRFTKRLLRIGLYGGGGLLCAATVEAQLPAHLNQTFPVNSAIPDNQATGLLRVGTVLGSGITQIGDVNVWLEIGGGYNGDLYVTLAHNTGYAVLLNRPGRRPEAPYGYADPGLTETFHFDDTAPNGDVHLYRLTLHGDHDTPLNGPLSGVWAPDARAVSPYAVTETDVRTANLSSFHGLAADGDWTIFFADVEALGQSTVISWGLEIVAVPEPAQCITGLGLVMLSWAMWLRFGRSQRPDSVSRLNALAPEERLSQSVLLNPPHSHW